MKGNGQNVTGNIIKDGITGSGSNHSIVGNLVDQVWMMTDGVLIKNNLITGSDFGIAIGGRENTILNNTIENCPIALSFWAQAQDNMVYHNNFINNTVLWQPGHLSNPHVGSWDNGAEGNYWSNYNGTDNNSNGIGDTPYVIDLNNQDNYPIMEEFIIPENNLTIFGFLVLGIILLTLKSVYFKKEKD